MLRERGIEPEIVDYLKDPPDEAAIADLLDRLGVAPRELIRTKEQAYKELGLGDPELGRNELIRAIATHPRLLERPIVVSPGGAVIGRPTERVLEVI